MAENWQSTDDDSLQALLDDITPVYNIAVQFRGGQANPESSAVGNYDAATVQSLLDAGMAQLFSCGAVFGGTLTMVTDQQAVTIGGSTYTFTVVDGAITAIAVS